MNPFECVIAIIFLAIAGQVITHWIKARERRYESQPASFDEANELRDQIVTLEDRIQVLERIVTDTSSSEDLRQQFRDLERS